MRAAWICGVALLVAGCDPPGGKVGEAKSRALDIARYTERFRVKYGRYPASLDDLTRSQAEDDLPFMAPEHIRDPWGKKFMFRVEEDNGGEHVVVYTISPRGHAISGTAGKR